FTPLSVDEQARLASFLALGRGVHLTGERPCCEELNLSLQSLARAVVVGGSSIQIGGLGDIAGPHTFNPEARGGITTGPNALTTWTSFAPGGIAGISGANVLVSGARGIPVGAGWDSSDLVGGAGISQTSVAEPLVSVRGGSLDVGTGGTGHLFDLAGRPANTQTDPQTGLTLGTDRPLQPGAEAPVFEATNATVNVRGSAYRVDTALLEATAPLLNLVDGATLVTGAHAVDLVGRARVSMPNDAIAMINLNGSS